MSRAAAPSAWRGLIWGRADVSRVCAAAIQRGMPYTIHLAVHLLCPRMQVRQYDKLLRDFQSVALRTEVLSAGLNVGQVG